MDKRPTILVCGTVHFAWKHDLHTTDMGDVRGERRRREIEGLVERLAAFRPTHVCLEVVELGDHEVVNDRYHRYLAGSCELDEAESEQVGFRLAQRMGHEEVYPVD